MAGWTVLVPVKRLAVAKSRLTLPAPVRADLVLAMAADTVAAASACPVVTEVVVVTADAVVTAHLRPLGVLVVAEPTGAGLNPALRHAADVVRRRAPHRGLAALTADLPGLRSGDLADLLAAVPTPGRGVVADAAGAGSTLLAAAAGPLQPSFGPGSFDRHRRSGAVDLTRFASAGLRRDVDTLADLRLALRHGVGPRTAGTGERLAQ